MKIGLSHITIIVEDLEKSTKLFQDVFDAKKIYNSGDQTNSIAREVFLLIGDVWLALMESNENTQSISEKTYNHIAFAVEKSDFDRISQKIEDLNLSQRWRKRVDGEAESIYFYDYDNHLFELHTGDLDSRLKAYEKIN